MTIFRPADERSATRNVAWTAAQVVVVWSLTLVVVPAVLLRMERALRVPNVHDYRQPMLAVILFIAFSVLNIATGTILAVRGRGTPLPLAAPRALVVMGPYRYVRNPMAIAGIGQGLAMSLWFGSWVLLVYSLLGALVWHVIIRPAEEHDLMRRFGDTYPHYRAAVPLWRPRLRPYP